MPTTFRATSAYAASTILLLSMATHNVRAATTLVGCFSSSQPLSSQGTATYQSSAYCSGVCTKKNQAVLGLSGGNTCWCGDELPPADSQVADGKCNTPCQGYPGEDCGGGSNYYTVWLTGTESNVPNYGGGGSVPSSSIAPAPSSTNTVAGSPRASTTKSPAHTHGHPNKPSVVTSMRPNQTIVVTQPASTSSSTPAPGNSSGGPNVAAIAAGVVVGVVVLAAIVAGLFFWMRHKRRHAAESEYKRSTQIRDFMRGGERKPPPTGYSTTSDSRLDPEAGNHRNSQGSIADNEDYSRRILRVANPT